MEGSSNIVPFTLVSTLRAYLLYFHFQRGPISRDEIYRDNHVMNEPFGYLVRRHEVKASFGVISEFRLF